MKQTEYPLELWKRCKDWAYKDDGKLFWIWLESEANRLHDIASTELDGNPVKGLIDSQKALATEKHLRYISQFAEMIKALIDEKEKAGNDLTDISEL